MELITKVKSWAAALAEVGVSLIGLGIVLEILFGGMNIPFWPERKRHRKTFWDC